MNEGLIDAFRHNAWATRQVIAACQGLSDEQLQSTAIGVFGSIIDTLRHIVSAESSYQSRLMGEEPSWDRRADDSPGLETLAARNDELAARWERFLENPFDSERTFVIPWFDGQDYDVPAGVVLVQALHHGNEHRSQICTMLTMIGATPPELGVWEFAGDTGRANPQAS